MNKNSLIAIGLTPLQAEAYAQLIEDGHVKPPELAAKLKTTRTNAYKVLDRLVEIGLAIRTTQDNKAAYAAANPIALTGLTEQFRAEATAREELVGSLMQELLAKYHTHADAPNVTVATGRTEVAAAYRKQLSLQEDIYFIHTDADIPIMGFDVMHEIRSTPVRYKKQRFAIMTAPGERSTPINYAQHERSNLAITWAKQTDYSAPVEWSVTESSLLIVLYATEPHAILIADQVVAGAFLQLWRLLSTLLQAQPLHQTLTPRQ